MAFSWPRRKLKVEPTGLLVELFTHDGVKVGHHRALGSATPTFLFKGRELFVHAGEHGAMRTLAPLERPIMALVAAGVAMRTVKT